MYRPPSITVRHAWAFAKGGPEEADEKRAFARPESTISSRARWTDRLLAAALPGGALQPGFRTRLRDASPPLLRLGFVGAALLLALSPLWTGPRRLPGPLLSDADLDASLAEARRSRFYLLRQCATVVQLLACFGAWESPCD